jgi:hypothetical protein
MFPATLDADALAKAKALALPTLSDGDWLSAITAHWSVEDRGWLAAQGLYNIVIAFVAGEWLVVIVTPLELNASDPLSVGYAAHAYKDNSHNAGIAINALAPYPDGRPTSPSDFGPQPLEFAAVELLCGVAARLEVDYDIDPAQAQTHAERAIAGHYFVGEDSDPRWDLARLEPSTAPLTQAEAITTGNLLRARIAAYYAALTAGVVIS